MDWRWKSIVAAYCQHAALGRIADSARLHVRLFEFAENCLSVV